LRDASDSAATASSDDQQHVRASDRAGKHRDAKRRTTGDAPGDGARNRAGESGRHLAPEVSLPATGRSSAKAAPARNWWHRQIHILPAPPGRLPRQSGTTTASSFAAKSKCLALNVSSVAAPAFAAHAAMIAS